MSIRRFTLEEIETLAKLAVEGRSAAEAGRICGMGRSGKNIRQKFCELTEGWSALRGNQALAEAAIARFKEGQKETPPTPTITQDTKTGKTELERELEAHCLKHRGPLSLAELSEAFDRSEKAIGEALKNLEANGCAIELSEDGNRVMAPETPSKSKRTLDVCDWNRNIYHWGVLGDTHFGAKQCQFHYIEEVYKRFGELGCDTVFHLGDVFHGSPKMHRGFEHELVLLGCDEQEDWVAENYPRVKNSKGKWIKTYMLGGGHDYSWWKTAGIDIVKRLCNRRDDLIYLGKVGNYIKGPGDDPFFAYFFHPSDGTAYAVSYKDQKSSEQLYPHERPQLHFTGHYHKWNWIELLGTNFFQTMAMCSQTDWMKSKRLVNILGAFVLEFNISKTGFVNRLKVEKYNFHQVMDMSYGERNVG